MKRNFLDFFRKNAESFYIILAFCLGVFLDYYFK